MAVGSVLGALGFPLALIAVFAGAEPTRNEYTFGWEQKAGVVIGCAAVWLACIVLSGWRPRAPVNGEPLGALRAMLRGAQATASQSTWFELSQARTVRRLGVVQAVVILATALSLLAFTSAPWYTALLAALVLSIGLNLAISRFSRLALSRERRRRSR
jgi:hypothetical protein